MKAFDLIVVGGGPAGACAARSAVREGLRTVLLERNAGPAEKICGEYLCPGGVAMLRELGLSDALARSGAAEMRGIRLFGPSGLEARTHFPGSVPGASLNRALFDFQLSAACGAEVVRGSRVTGLHRDGEEAIVALEDGREFSAPLVVAADGRHSTIACRAGLHRPDRGPPRATLHAHFRGVGDRLRFGEMHLRGDGQYAGLNPCPDGRVNVTWVCDLADAERGSLEERLDSTPSLAARFRGAERSGPVRLLAPLEVSVARPYADRVLLAGDAAGFFDPLTGEGMFGAIAAGRLAGSWAARAVRAGDASARFLRGYGAGRRRAIGSKERLNRLFQWFLRQPRLLDSLARRMGRAPAVGDAFIGVVGNVLPPAELLRPSHYLRLLVA
jgi:flavin-dependent dehydrogenase